MAAVYSADMLQEQRDMRAANQSWKRSFGYSVGLVVVFNLIFLVWILLKPKPEKLFVMGDDVGQALGWLFATVLCFVGYKSFWRHTSTHSGDATLARAAQRCVPLLIALGIFCQFIGQVIYTYYDLVGLSPFPSWADVAYLSTFPFLLMGILLLPIRPLSRVNRARVMLDAIMILTAVVTFSWYFVLGPNMLIGRETIFATIVGSAYPFFDLILILCVLRLSFRFNDFALRPTVFLLSLGLVIIVITDSIYDYQTLQNIYVNGWQDIGWPIGYMLLGLAAQAFSTMHVWQTEPQTGLDRELAERSTTTISSEWHALLPYVFVPAVILLAIYTWRTGVDGILERGVYIGGIAIIGLVLLRQFFAIREIIFYNKELRWMQHELSRKNNELSEANIQLEAQAVQVEAAYEQQRHLNDLKDQFLLNVNHELRTPLTEIHGYLNLLTEYSGQIDANMQTTFLEHALHGCEELQNLIGNVLDALRGDFLTRPLKCVDLSVSTVVGEVLNLFEPQKRQDYHLVVDISETLSVKADRQHLHQVLLNLLSNAFKYSPKQTSVTISARIAENSIGEDADSPVVCISVQDTGPGIPPSEIPVLFGKFVRLKRDMVGTIRGTGLGLYICKQLVEAMQGRIWVESSGVPGEGSRFSFTLPSALYSSIGEQSQVQFSEAFTSSSMSKDGVREELELLPMFQQGELSSHVVEKQEMGDR